MNGTITKIYRVSGLILIAYGIVGFICYLITRASEKGLNIMTYSFLIGMLTIYAINPFFWVGRFLFHKAIKNDQTIKKPTWLLWLLNSYVVCGSIIVVLLVIVLIRILLQR